MNLFITGGCGFLGSNLAHHGITQQWKVTVYDNLLRYGADLNLEWLRSTGPVNFVAGDTRNPTALEQAVAAAKPDFVFHLAGQVAMTTSVSDPRMDFEINALGTLNLLEAVRKRAPEAGVLYSSTNKVYGDLRQFSFQELETRYSCPESPEGFDEKVPLEFHSPYGCSKGAADQYVLDYNRIYGVKSTVFRHSSMYGGRQFATYDQGWIGWFCKQALETSMGTLKKPIKISGNGKQVRDVLHAADMVSLYFYAADNMTKIAGHAFNIGGGISNSLSLLELFRILEGLSGTKLALEHGPARESDQLVFVANIAKASKLIGWTPKVSFQEGIASMYEWTRNSFGR
jgi:CDP-paratose 2-epimerase